MRIVCKYSSPFNLINPPKFKNTWAITSVRMEASFLFFFNFIALSFATLINSVTCKELAALRLNRFKHDTPRFALTCTKVTSFFKTIQRGPMAHRQWSQEQLTRISFDYTLTFELPTEPTLLSEAPAVLISALQPANLNFGSSFMSVSRHQTSRTLLTPIRL